MPFIEDDYVKVYCSKDPASACGNCNIVSDISTTETGRIYAGKALLIGIYNMIHSNYSEGTNTGIDILCNGNVFVSSSLYNGRLLTLSHRMFCYIRILLDRVIGRLSLSGESKQIVRDLQNTIDNRSTDVSILQPLISNLLDSVDMQSHKLY
jgi:hypothetical protein